MTPLSWPDHWSSPLWALAVIVVAGVALVAIGIMGPRLFRGTRPVTVRALLCPRRRQRFDVQFQVTAWEGARVDVSRCAAFSPPSAVACDKACIAADPAETDGRPIGP